MNSDLLKELMPEVSVLYLWHLAPGTVSHFVAIAGSLTRWYDSATLEKMTVDAKIVRERR